MFAVSTNCFGSVGKNTNLCVKNRCLRKSFSTTCVTVVIVQRYTVFTQIGRLLLNTRVNLFQIEFNVFIMFRDFLLLKQTLISFDSELWFSKKLKLYSLVRSPNKWIKMRKLCLICRASTIEKGNPRFLSKINHNTVSWFQASFRRVSWDTGDLVVLGAFTKVWKNSEK